MAVSLRPSPARPGVTPARRCAFAVLGRVAERGAYADRALHAEARSLPPRERALATRLVFGTLQRLRTIDHVAGLLSTRPVAELDPAVRTAVRLGLYQMLWLDGVADHAAVNESVELAKADGSAGGARLVNAVLRRATREGGPLLGALSDATASAAALAHSLPDWVAELWWETLGALDARALMARVNTPAESALRANALRHGARRLAAGLPVAAHSDPDLPEALVLEEAFDAHASPLWASGAFMPQSRASMVVGRALGPLPGERVLDLCAAPGAKTTHLAALMGDRGRVVAVERHAGRAASLRRTCARMGARCVEVVEGDAAQLGPGGEFDRVLVDPPCSGLGTLQSRPDLRWRASPAGVSALAAEQARILDAAAPAVRAGGLLVYSTCTISPAENELQIERFLARHPEFEPAPPDSDLRTWEHPRQAGQLLVLPHVHATDGFFIARLRRAARTAGR